ncbi:hypothetical protein [Kouleothrix sp.]|uniref:hypothetical protein n=1 Tax=Kouleothrix sp. TaxID=2779161 RepID=UPI00391916AD
MGVTIARSASGLTEPPPPVWNTCSGLIGEVLCADPLSLPILDRFAEVVVQDSTTIPCPGARCGLTGCGNGTPDAGNAALKLQVALDLRTGRAPDPARWPRVDVATLHHDLPQGAVRLVDLGYLTSPCWRS